MTEYDHGKVVLDTIIGALQPGERIVDGERVYSAAYLDDRHLHAVPDGRKENKMDTDFPAALALAADDANQAIPYETALGIFYEHVRDYDERINVGAHGIPLEFFARDDVRKVRVIASKGGAWVTGELVVGEHGFAIYSREFPIGAGE